VENLQQRTVGLRRIGSNLRAKCGLQRVERGRPGGVGRARRQPRVRVAQEILAALQQRGYALLAAQVPQLTPQAIDIATLG